MTFSAGRGSKLSEGAHLPTLLRSGTVSGVCLRALRALAVQMPLERARYDVNGETLIVIGLPDRRVRGGGEILWCMQKSFERILFGSNSSAIHRLYERCALQQVHY